MVQMLISKMNMLSVPAVKHSPFRTWMMSKIESEIENIDMIKVLVDTEQSLMYDI